MRAVVTKLGKGSALYGMSLMLQKVLHIILLPIYTRFLAPDQYGILTLLNTCGHTVAPLLSLGLGSAVIWSVTYRRTDVRQTFGSVQAFQFLYGLALTGLLLIWAPYLAGLVFGNPAYAGLLRLIFLVFFLETTEHLLFSHFLIKDRVGLMALAASARFVVSAALHIFFLAYMEMGVPGVVLAQLSTSLLFGTAAWIVLWTKHPPRFDMPGIGPLLHYGWPIVPAYLCSMVLTLSDRFFLQYFRNEFEVGLYTLAYNIGLVINLLVLSIQQVWQKQMFDTVRDDPDASRTIGRLFTAYAALLGVAGLGLTLFRREIIALLTPPEYHAAARVVPLIVAAYALNGLTLATNIGMKVRNRNHLSLPIVAAAALLNLGLNFLLVPRYGMMGAAWATLCAYFVRWIIYRMVDQRLWPISFEYGRLLILAGLLGGASGMSALLTTDQFQVDIAVKLSILGLTSLLLWGLYHICENCRGS